jgi:hypothetical protein
MRKFKCKFLLFIEVFLEKYKIFLTIREYNSELYVFSGVTTNNSEKNQNNGINSKTQINENTETNEKLIENN